MVNWAVTYRHFGKCFFVLFMLSTHTWGQRHASATQRLNLVIPPALIISAPITAQSTTTYTPPPAGSNANPYFEIDNTLTVSFNAAFSISVKATGDMESPTVTNTIPINSVRLSLGLPNGTTSGSIALSTNYQVIVPSYNAGLAMPFTTMYFFPVNALNITKPEAYSTTLIFQFDQL